MHIDYHVEVDGHRYSVPHALVGPGAGGAHHRRAWWRCCIAASAWPATPAAPARRLHHAWTSTCRRRTARTWSGRPQRLIHWGQSIGPATGRVRHAAAAALQHPEHGYRACLGLLGLARYGPARLEAACALALDLGACRYRHVRDILANNRDQVHAAGRGRLGQPDARQRARPGLLPLMTLA